MRIVVGLFVFAACAVLLAATAPQPVQVPGIVTSLTPEQAPGITAACAQLKAGAAQYLVVTAWGATYLWCEGGVRVARWDTPR